LDYLGILKGVVKRLKGLVGGGTFRRFDGRFHSYFWGGERINLKEGPGRKGQGILP